LLWVIGAEAGILNVNGRKICKQTRFALFSARFVARALRDHSSHCGLWRQLLQPDGGATPLLIKAVFPGYTAARRPSARSNS